MSDLSEYLENDKHVQELMERGFSFEKPPLKPFIKYIEGGHIGDNDVISEYN